MPKEIFITKADGTKEKFEESKLFNSLLKAGASKPVAEKVVEHVSREITAGATTANIYRHAFEFLRRLEQPVTARYSLKRALVDLGPSGFPFEKFAAEIFKAKGYLTMLDQTVLGACVDHEIDVVAWNDDKLIMVEAKFHNELGLKSDLKVALYSKARYDDLRDLEFNFGKKRKLDEGWLITNTNFTDKAIKYSECVGITMVGWNYPAKGNLHDLIEESELHPLTCLNTLNNFEKKNLMDRGVVLCKSVRENPSILKEIGVSNERVEDIVNETNLFCPSV